MYSCLTAFVNNLRVWGWKGGKWLVKAANLIMKHRWNKSNPYLFVKWNTFMKNVFNSSIILLLKWTKFGQVASFCIDPIWRFNLNNFVPFHGHNSNFFKQNYFIWWIDIYHYNSWIKKTNIIKFVVVCQTFPNLFLKWIRSVVHWTYARILQGHINGWDVSDMWTTSILKNPCFKCSSGSLSKSTNY